MGAWRMPSRYPIRGALTALAAGLLSACATVKYPKPERITLEPKPPDAQQRVIVVAPAADVRLLSLAGPHDKDPGRSQEATNIWRDVVAQWSVHAASTPVTTETWDAATRSDWQ